MERTMFYGASPLLFERARVLRENMTDAENKLWHRLSKNQLGVRFKPQHPAASFILDFYCHSLKLAIELDGDSHLQQKEYDASRSEELQQYGIEVIRFSNEEMNNNEELVITKINEAIKHRKHQLAK